MNTIHRTIRLLAAGTAAAAFAALPVSASAGPPLAAASAAGGPLPIANTEHVYSNHDPKLAQSLGLAAGIDIDADLDAAGHALRWRVLVDGAEKFAFMQAAELQYDKKLQVRFADLTGDGVQEMLVYRKASDDKGGQGLSVYDGARSLRLLFDVTDPSFTIADLAQRYELRAAGGGVRLTDPASGLSGVIPDAAAEGAAVEPVAAYEFDDGGSIVAVQRIVGGQAAADGERSAIGWLRTTYTYRYGAFVPDAQSLTDAQGRPLAAQSLLHATGPGTASDDM